MAPTTNLALLVRSWDCHRYHFLVPMSGPWGAHEAEISNFCPGRVLNLITVNTIVNKFYYLNISWIDEKVFLSTRSCMCSQMKITLLTLPGIANVTLTLHLYSNKVTHSWFTL